MTKIILLSLALVFAISCTKENKDEWIKQENGRVWLSGGLAYCAQQIHLENGDTLVVDIADVISFKSGVRVSVKYKEIGESEFCPPGIDCEIIEIKEI